MKLYELTNELAAFLQAIENDEIPEDAINDTLEAIQGEIELKADDIACLLKNLDAEAKAIKEEETKLAERRKAKEKSYERIKEYLAESLQRVGIDKVETARNKITFRKSESVYVADEAAFIEWAEKENDGFLTYKAPTINKTAIKDALKNGVEIVGAEMRTNYNLQLK